MGNIVNSISNYLLAFKESDCIRSAETDQGATGVKRIREWSERTGALQDDDVLISGDDDNDDNDDNDDQAVLMRYSAERVFIS